MSEFNVQPDKVFRVTGAGKEMDISNGTFDHAVRYPQAYNWLDHIVTFEPMAIQVVNQEIEEEYEMYCLNGVRHFLGYIAVETIVRATDLHEIYANVVTESVHEDYLEQQGNNLDDLDFDVFDEGEED